MDRYQAFWPLPGSVDKFIDALLKVLTFIKQNSPSEERLTDWFVENFEKVSAGGATRGYIRNTLFHTGLVNHDKKAIFLSDTGEKYLASPDNVLLFRILDENIVGFRETLESISQKEMEMDELAKVLTRKLSMSWESVYGQPYWRVCWLRSMGFVAFEGGKFRLTQAGIKLLNSLPKASEVERPTAQIEEKKPPKTSEAKAVTYLDVQEIAKKLRSSQHLSQEPSKFEDAIAESFVFLGFSTRQLGMPGDTDVLATAYLGKESSYSIVVDGKTTQGERISERQISWDSLSDHKKNHHADFTVVVGVSFAGGDLLERADKHQVTLIETETLINLLEIHHKTPLDLEDLKELFVKKGVLRLEDCGGLWINIEEYEKKQQLIPGVSGSLRRLQQQKQRTDASFIYWELAKKFEYEDIKESLDLLEKMGFVSKTADGQWISLMPSRVAAKRLTLIVDSFLSEGETRRQEESASSRNTKNS
jgi:hypothetical protein